MRGYIFAIIILFSSFNLSSQALGIVNSDGTSSQITFIKRDKESEKEKFKRIAYKMYEADTLFKATKVDDINEPVFLRYNLYKDEMEFQHKGQTLFLKKEKNRKIIFQNTNQEYRLYPIDNKLKYFLVHNNAKILLLSRKSVSYVEAKSVENSYQSGKPAFFRREKDKFYMRYDNGDIVELPIRKKKFPTVFEESNDVKKFIKQNKINIKNIEDLKKVITYVNGK